MSKMSKVTKSMKKSADLHLDKAVMNFMGGLNYKLDPIQTLKMVASSSIFGEPSYYRGGAIKEKKFSFSKEYVDQEMVDLYSSFDGKSTTDIFTQVIDKALDFDFEETLKIAVDLRNNYYMRLNPQVIMVRAAIHPKRDEWTKENPGKFAEYESKVMSRADEPMTQLTYYIYNNNGKKNNIPTILKKSCAKKLSALSEYEVNKYKNHEIGMINAVRLTHAHSDVLNNLMKNGNIEVKDDIITWEQYISNNGSNEESWNYVVDNIFTHESNKENQNSFSYEGKKYVASNHMATLRNLKNIAIHCDEFHIKKAIEALKIGVKSGKQFPFRYKSAYTIIEECDDVKLKPVLLDALEECIDISIVNMPHLKGKTMSLSDNSGSAWGTFNSEYGKQTVANIDNLSAAIAAKCSDEGYVGKFGDELKVYSIKKRDGILSQTNKIDEDRGEDVGHATEGGIWKFFKKAINEKEHWDNVFIFSDMQCNHSGLYGTHEDIDEYTPEGYNDNHFINVFKLIQDYHKKVNKKCNFYCIQTAGYNNICIPENSYRCTTLSGWTGKEILYASAMNEFWDSVDAKNKKHKK